MRQAPLEQLCPYACEDADITFKLKEFLKKWNAVKAMKFLKK